MTDTKIIYIAICEIHLKPFCFNSSLFFFAVLIPSQQNRKSLEVPLRKSYLGSGDPARCTFQGRQTCWQLLGSSPDQRSAVSQAMVAQGFSRELQWDEGRAEAQEQSCGSVLEGLPDVWWAPGQPKGKVFQSENGFYLQINLQGEGLHGCLGWRAKGKEREGLVRASPLGPWELEPGRHSPGLGQDKPRPPRGLQAPLRGGCGTRCKH